MQAFITVEINETNATAELVRHFVRRVIPRYFGRKFEQEAILAVADIEGEAHFFHIAIIGQDLNEFDHYNEFQCVVKHWIGRLGEENATSVFSSMFASAAMTNRDALTLSAHICGDFIKCYLANMYFQKEV